MKNNAKAILFDCQNNMDTTLFTNYKKYSSGTGYIVTENTEKGLCYICRILDNDELKFFKNELKKLVINTDEGAKELNIVIISKKYTNISDVENNLKELLERNE